MTSSLPPTLTQSFHAGCTCSFEDGVRLVQLRGESMQAAADAQPSAMVSVIGLDADQVQLLCEVRLSAVKACVACRCEGAQAGLCDGQLRSLHQ